MYSKSVECECVTLDVSKGNEAGAQETDAAKTERGDENTEKKAKAAAAAPQAVQSSSDDGESSESDSEPK